MNTHILIRRAFQVAACLLLGGSLSAQTILWNEDFSGSTLNPNLTGMKSGDGVVPSLSDGKITFNSGSIGFAQSKIYTAKTQTGAVSLNGHDVYNFFDEGFTVSVSDISFTGTGGDLFIMIGAGIDAFPRGAIPGVFLRLERTSSGSYTLSLNDKGAGGLVKGYTYSLSSLPTSLSLSLNADGWEMTVGGTTFSAGGTSRSGDVWTYINSTDFDTAIPYLSIGTVNYLATGSNDFTASISGFEVVTAVPEPSESAFLFGLSTLIGLWLLRRRSR
ncbi:hypothetical protein H5P28_06760 [Ruficoccus amylovorans]|uniref:PEP-CTERM protein-sorting domain-containing protein n=1 Tax=Ruficoccus amylovorans TaxID=1804625 RepID=A0A842HCN5_9BACT|nr:hypothetical protein [Ruficoccus amylovorans]MBC2593959.1 hypothetical protein [Ruficoccus amylovorans]